MEAALWYFSGLILFMIGHYIYNVYIVKNNYQFKNKYNCNLNKKLVLYEGFKFGLFSWISVFTCLTIGIVGGTLWITIIIDDYIKDKLSN